jgi:hypothetical protein
VREIPLNDERDKLVACAAKLTEGLFGREIRTCIRLALPKPLLDPTNEDPSLTMAHLEGSISDVRRAQIEVGSPVLGPGTGNDAKVVKELLGLK